MKIRGRLSITDAIKLQAYVSHKLSAITGGTPLQVVRHGNTPHPTYLITANQELADTNIALRMQMDGFLKQMEKLFPEEMLDTEEVEDCADNPYRATNTPGATAVAALNFTTYPAQALRHAEQEDKENFIKVMRSVESQHHGRFGS